MKASRTITPCRWLVLGYGNPLCGDDGAGPRLAERVAAWGLPGVTALALPQLVPELAIRLAECDAVVFADASVRCRRVRFQLLRPRRKTVAPGHFGDPAALLAITRLVFGVAPRAWLLRLPAREFGLGQGLSVVAARGLHEAEAQLRRLTAERSL